MAAWPRQRWHIHPESPEAPGLAAELGVSPLVGQLLINRGFPTTETAQFFLDPSGLALPSPITVFPDLNVCLDLLQAMVDSGRPMAICGDYDADGMTSTALLLRALRALGGTVDYAIPSRMTDGYGINQRIVEEFHQQGIHLILTVDNGIAAVEPIARARQLGLAVIVTDHHEPPPELPPANGILNPKLTDPDSPYSGMAGVGVAYLLALGLAHRYGRAQELAGSLLDLFTLGTIADLAPLVGVNRRWVQQGLRRLPHSQILGVQALMQVAGLAGPGVDLKPEAVGFSLGPRINAVGRIGDPQVVIELFTTEDPEVAWERAQACEQVNRTRQQLCTEIEQAAIQAVEASALDPHTDRVLALVQPDWHHGVIGIVASRLVERYGRPVFIATYEDEAGEVIRGSARGIPEFHIYEALVHGAEYLERFGGHRAAGGFTLRAEHWSDWCASLQTFAQTCLAPEHLRPLIRIDAQADFLDLNLAFWQDLDRLHPCGVDNPDPVFWTPRVRVVHQTPMGQQKAHLRLTLAQTLAEGTEKRRNAVAWRWGDYHPLPEVVDVAYKLRQTQEQGEVALQLELVGVRPAAPVSLQWPTPPQSIPSPVWESFESLETLVAETQGRLLVYGHGRPELTGDDTLVVDYDRPQGITDTILFWTLPPSTDHLDWILAMAQPRRVACRYQVPSLPTVLDCQDKLSEVLVENAGLPLNLLALGQQWWVSPPVILAGLRTLGYPFPEWPATLSLAEELAALRTWYQLGPDEG
ncbi:MAG: single-stranded-DNA-specific exonuclease RecJ [Gloeomargaritaceae cyanobacterium C42_A2020_066]|nr:single-stranded-DNA-specific exonuclease RecJ [Gloeomargaritaceae cyanobacterium C42_A2020_066]